MGNIAKTPSYKEILMNKITIKDQTTISGHIREERRTRSTSPGGTPDAPPTSTRPAGPSGQTARPDCRLRVRSRALLRASLRRKGEGSAAHPEREARGATVWRGCLVNPQTRLSTWRTQTWRVIAHFPTQLSQQIAVLLFFFFKARKNTGPPSFIIRNPREKNHCC